MIEVPEQTQPVRKEAGHLYFSVFGSKGKYKLELYPPTGQFLLTYPTGKEVESSIKELDDDYVRFDLYEKGLAHWIYRAYKQWSDPLPKSDQLLKTKKITIEGITYQVEYSMETDQVWVTTPGKVVVCYLHEVTEAVPEALYLHHGEISNLMWDLVYRGNDGKDPKNQGEESASLPVTFMNPSEYLVEGETYHLAYDPDQNLLFIQLPTRIHKTHKALLSTIPYVQNAHEGKLLAELKAFTNSKNPISID